jgi:hypothetical protein
MSNNAERNPRQLDPPPALFVAPGLRLAMELLKWLTSWLHRNLFFSISFVSGAVILRFVPQVFNLWYSDPPPSGSGAVPWVTGWLLFALFLVLAFLYFLVSIYVIPWPNMRQRASSPRGSDVVPSPRAVVVERERVSSIELTKYKFIVEGVWKLTSTVYLAMSAVVERIVSTPVRLLHCFGVRRRAVFVGVAVILAIALLAIQAVIGANDRSSLLTAPFARNFAWWLLSISIWAAVYVFIGRERIATTNSPGGMFLLQTGRILMWLGFTYLLAETLWLGARTAWVSDWVSYRAYTLWVIVNIWGVAVVLGSCLDYLDAQIEFVPVRIVAFLLLVVFLLISRPAPNSETQIVSPATSPPSIVDGYTALEAKIRSIPDDQPVILVAASGGGSRAAIFTALVFEFLATHPILATMSNRDGTLAAESERFWADNIILISCVSGGSLATAHFVQRDCKKSEIRPTTRYTIEAELLSQLRRNIGELSGQGLSTGSADPEFESASKRAQRMLESIELYSQNKRSQLGLVDAWATVLPQSELEFSFAGVSITPSKGGFHGSSPERIQLTGA